MSSESICLGQPAPLCRQLATEAGALGPLFIAPAMKSSAKDQLCVLIWILKKEAEILTPGESLSLKKRSVLPVHTQSTRTLENIGQELSGCGKGQYGHLDF